MLIMQSVTLHTSLGDLKLEVFCEEVPRTAENFLALCGSGYYNETIFHRNIRGCAPIAHAPAHRSTIVLAMTTKDRLYALLGRA